MIELAGRSGSYTGDIPKLPVHALLQLQLAITRLDRITRQVPPAEPWTAPRAAEWDAETVESWWLRYAVGADVRAMLRQTVRMTFGCEASEMSLLSLLQYVSSAGGLAHDVDRARHAAEVPRRGIAADLERHRRGAR